ncbi:MAG TPA: winged helix-turn-helix domain-containing tetratricopeptide repeat protein [Stellaceae bacterium]|nr:winged helix-turn-helix domain-containing tetratricopeptide repeat protein [Stellaceae bacterium]
MNREERVSSGVFAFENFRFDHSRGELLRLDRSGNAEPVAIGSRARDLLGLLVEERGLVSKERILDRVWPGICVEEANLTVQISALRRILDRDRGGGSFIQTVHGRGYRFAAPVRKVARGVVPDIAEASAPAVPDKPSIAVLPFANLSGDRHQQYFADGMAEEIITALSHIRSLFVIARGSSFTYRGQAVDVQRVGRELGVRYVLAGSVRKSGRAVRIAAQLTEAETRLQLWADRFDGVLDRIFELQDSVATSVAAMIEPTMEANEISRSMRCPTDNLTAYDWYLRALPECFSYSAEPQLRALKAFEKAIACDPGFGRALALSASCRQLLACAGWGEDPQTNRRAAIDLARRALQVANNDPVVLAEAARVLAYFDDREVEAAISLVERAVALNPNYSRGWYWNGWVRLYAGDPELALAHFRTSLRLNPRHQTQSFMTGTGVAHFFCGRYQEACEALLEALNVAPGWPTTYRFLAAAYERLGRLTEAREVVERLRKLTPALASPADRSMMPPFRKHMDRYLESLRRAVGEDSVAG